MTTLATLEDFALARGLAFDPTDAAATIALEGASAAIRGWCHNAFDRVEDVELTVDGTGTDSLVLPALNIAVTTVEEEGEEVASDEYKVAAREGILYRDWPATWRKGRRNIVITLDWGWEIYPPEVTMVAIAVATRIYTTATSGGATISAEQVGRYQVTYDTGAGEGAEQLSPLEKTILSPFRIGSVK